MFLRCLAVCTATALAAAPSVPRLESIAIDGDLADWGEHGLHVPFLTPDSPRPPDVERSHASARFAWDGAGLLVGVSVTDTTPNEAHLASAAYLADSVEMFLAVDSAGSENVQLVLSPGRDPAHRAPRSFIFDNRSSRFQAAPKDAKWAVKPGANGYVAEARLPWSALGIQPAPGLAVATRLYVNDDDDAGRRTRYLWQPEAKAGRFHALVLAAAPASRTLNEPVAWTALDLVATAGRVNMMAQRALAGSSWQVRQGGDLLGVLELEQDGAAATGTLTLPAGRRPGSLTLAGPDKTVLTVTDTLSSDAAGVIARANSGYGSAMDKSALAFARVEVAQHIFSGSRFPLPNFRDPARVARLVGASPSIATRWLDADGREVTHPTASGCYGARTEVTIPGRAKPLIVEHILYRLPDGAYAPSVCNETEACIYAFRLQGADATPSHSARVAERWWHRVRRARGWSEALPYKIHVPDGTARGPRPLIVHLHGSGQYTDMAVSERLPLLVKQAGPEPIIVYPQSPSGWRGPAVGELIDDLQTRYSIDPSRVYLIGFSLGGIGCWEVAMDQPERFAAVVPIGGRMGSPADAGRLKNVAVWVLNGEEDPGTTCEEARIMVDALRQVGATPRFTLLPGKSHGDSQDEAYRFPGLFEWMLAQRRR